MGQKPSAAPAPNPYAQGETRVGRQHIQHLKRGFLAAKRLKWAFLLPCSEPQHTSHLCQQPQHFIFCNSFGVGSFTCPSDPFG